MPEAGIIQHGKYRYLEAGSGPSVLFLHGLFGTLSNFSETMSYLSPKYRVIVPVLPLYELELDQSSVSGLVDFISGFTEALSLSELHLIGNSLGGHIAILFAHQHPERVRSITLTGSSGLFENSLGDTYPRKGDLEYVRKKTEGTFFNPAMATDELVQHVYEIVNDRNKALRIVLIAKSAIRHNLRELLPSLNHPVNLIWGKQDSITPPFVGEEFQKLLPNARLHLIENCGHAPMMEVPHEFNQLTEKFLAQNLHHQDTSSASLA